MKQNAFTKISALMVKSFLFSALFIFTAPSIAFSQIDETTQPFKDEVFVPQKFDVGISLGTAFSTSSYILIEGFSGLEVSKCGDNCAIYVDVSMRVAAQNGETHYIGTAGPRFQKYFADSSWGPYLRPFAGLDHYLFVGQAKDYGLAGLALGTYYSLHPAADARFEIAQSLGVIPLTYVTVGFSFRLENL